MITSRQIQLLAELKATDSDHYMAKFCDDPLRWYRIAIRRYNTLSYNKQQWPRKILDIGCGFGYFVLTCKDAGEHATGIDVPDPFIRRATQILDAPCEVHTVTAFVPLPPEYCDLDLVTSFGVMFRHGPPSESGTYWTWPEYAFLASDICSRLRPEGRWIVRPNRISEQQHDFRYMLDPQQWQAAVGDVATVVIVGEQITLTPKH